MPPRKRKPKLRPKLPSRVKKRRPAKKTRPRQHHPELWGLAAVALGLFLGSVLYLGWNGGYVGRWFADGLDAVIGSASYGMPAALVVLGLLTVAKSALVDVRPFRTGLVVVAFGLMTTLGRDQGGYLGSLLGSAFGVAIGVTGSTILGVLLLLVGSLLLSGASLGAILRRSGRTARTVAARARERRPREPVDWLEPEDVPLPPSTRRATSKSPVDGQAAYPDVVGEETASSAHALAPSPLLHSEPAPLLTQQEPLVNDPPTLFDAVTSEHAPYKLPDAGVLRIAPERAANSEETSARVAELLVQTLAHFGVEANVDRPDLRPARHPLRAPARARARRSRRSPRLKDDLSYALATTEIRILAPIPGKQAVGVEVPNLSPEPRHARRHLRRPARDREPALGLARQGHLRQRRLDRPRAHAAPADRRHDRLGQVGLHQHAS